MKKMGAKAIVVALAGVLALGGAVGGTIAWLTDVTGEVKNTFTVGDIDITLTESVDTDSNGVESFKMVPGNTIDKDPVVKVLTGSEDCYLFVEVVEGNNLTNFISYTVDPTKWLPLDNLLRYPQAMPVAGRRLRP